MNVGMILVKKTARRRFVCWASIAPVPILGLLAALGMSAPLGAQPSPTGPQPGLPTAWTQGSWKPGQAVYGVGEELDVPVRMSDGVVIRASIAYPTELSTEKRAPGVFPVLLEQSPYDEQLFQSGAAKELFRSLTRYFVSRGYIYVMAEVRGTHESGGDFGLVSTREQEDGVELVKWVAHRLAGSNGRVGLAGCSYTGLNQYFTAAMVGRNSPVKAMAPNSVGPDWYREPGFVGGVPTGTLEFALADVWANGGSESAVRFTLSSLADIKAGGATAYDGMFWRTRAAADLIQRIVDNGIPALIFASWNDYPTSTGEAYAMFQNAYAGTDVWAPMGKDQKITDRYQLIIGSGQHCEGRDDGPMATADLEWFDTWLKGMDTGLEHARTSLHLYELGSDHWVSGGVYPQVGRYRTLYLGAGGKLTPMKAGGREGSDAVRYAVPSLPGATLTYTSAPFAHGAVFAGPASATIYAKSTSSNVLIIADLFDVAPGGEAVQLTTGGLIGTMRALEEARSWRDRDGRLIRPYHEFTHDDPVKPGEVVRLDIQIQPRLAALAPGHALRLVLKSQSDPSTCATLFPGGHSFWCLDPTVTQRRELEGGGYDIERNGTWASLINVPLVTPVGRQ